MPIADGCRPGGSHLSRCRVTLQPPEIGAHLRGALVARFTVLFQGLTDNVIQFGWKFSIQSSRRYWRLVKYGIEDGCGSLTTKGELARGHLVQHSAEGEQVGARVQRLAKCLFRRHVGDGA